MSTKKYNVQCTKLNDPFKYVTYMITLRMEWNGNENGKGKNGNEIKYLLPTVWSAEQPLDEIIAEEAPGPVEQATAQAAEELQRLSLDGAAQVTNVKVTTDEREVIRRLHLNDKMKIAFEKIEEEAAEAQLKYDTITTNWDEMLKIRDPLDADDAIQQQKQKCDDLLGKKNELIQYLKDDLKKMDIAYYDDLDKQDREIKELSDRVEKQVTIMQRAYEKQLFLIEKAIVLERDAVVNHNNKRWKALYKQRNKEEITHLDYKFEQLEAHKDEMEKIMWEHYEKYREAKIELETLLQELQKELEKLKAVCIINGEKIAYNYQILKKREEENVFVRSQQKRKLNKMSDVVNGLRLKIRKASEDGALEEIRANDEIVKLLQAMADLEKKSDHFSQVNDYKFWQIWRMSAAKCAQLARELRRAEVALHAQVLAESAPPSLMIPKPIDITNPEEFPSKKSVEEQIEQEVVDPDDMGTAQAKAKLVRHILQLVADNTGFLLEDRLLKLIEKYQTESRNLCTLDAIFMALEIQAEEDIELLCKTFLKYAYCPICEGLDSVSTDTEENVAAAESPLESQHGIATADAFNKRVSERSSMRGRISTARSISATASRSAYITVRSQELSEADHQLMTEADEILQKCCPSTGIPSMGATMEGPGSSASGLRGGRGVTLTVHSEADVPVVIQNPYLCSAGHRLYIEAVQVLTALCDFTKVFVPPEKQQLYDILEDVKPRDFTTPSRRLKPEEINDYWNKWKNVFPSDKDKFWDGLLSGLNNYLPMLQERERLHEEVMVLRQRNAALHRLIGGTLPQLPKSSLPDYMREPPPAFTAPRPDLAQQILPPM